MAHRVGRTPRRAPRVFARPTVARSNAVPLTLAARHERSIHAFNSSVAASRLVSSRTEPNRTHQSPRPRVHPTTDTRRHRLARLVHTIDTSHALGARIDRANPRPRGRRHLFSIARAFIRASLIRAPLLARLSRLASPRLDSRPTVSHRLPPSHAPRIVVAILRRPSSSSSSVVVCRTSAPHPPASSRRRRLARREPFVSLDVRSCE